MKTEENTKTSLIDRMFQVGAHFGFAKSRRHPSALPFIFGKKNDVEIFDLEKVEEKLKEAKEFVSKIASQKRQILFVGGKRESQGIIKDVAEKIEMPYVAGRWIGGTLTNFEEIKKRVKKLQDLTSQKEKGELGKYTKKERLMIDREIEKLQERFGGIVSMDKKPAAIFIIDSDKESIARDEADLNKIPVISLMSSDCDMTKVKYPIPANDTSVKSIRFFAEEIADAYEEGLNQAQAQTK
ncbi:30S ribosomal protein S2 [Candidatus Parcubacteria bacterium]|nr:30S ribosomal protein S2 [Candidatus Parcubacteria bacterium]